MEGYQKLAIVVAIICGIVCTVFMLNSGMAQMSFNNPTSEEDYVRLEETAIRLIKNHGKNALRDEVFSFSESEVTFSVSSAKARVTARIPILSQHNNSKDETIEYISHLDFEDVKYERENLLKPAYVYILMSILGGCLTTFGVYLAFYDMQKGFRKKR